MIIFPDINPTALSILGLNIQWYGIAYVLGLFLGLVHAKSILKNKNIINKKVFDDLLIWIACGTIIGGRLGYALFYDFIYYFKNILLIITDIRKGGMSFHGGLLGVIISVYLFCKLKKVNFLQFMDVIACCAPIGIFFVRVTNFINSELWGKTTLLPWGVVFPNGGFEPRHPSQIYEALLEGLLLFVIINFIYKYKSSIHGYSSSLFLVFYSIFRILAEYFREPDHHIGYLLGNYLTTGMLLSIPMMLIGFFIFFKVNEQYRKNIKKKY